MAELRAREGRAARLLELTILTASRAGEARGARWDEFDLPSKTWTIPASRMKARTPHRVPLPDRVVEIIEGIPHIAGNGHVFAGRGSEAMSDMPVRQLLTEMRAKITLHGFRSSFRDWAGEISHAAREVIEHALAHGEGDATEQAYRRGDAFMKRGRLMQDWADYCGGKTPAESGNVIAIRR
jgi:integrase